MFRRPASASAFAASTRSVSPGNVDSILAASVACAASSEADAFEAFAATSGPTLATAT